MCSFQYLQKKQLQLFTYFILSD